jgi:hypothetical protein
MRLLHELEITRENYGDSALNTMCSHLSKQRRNYVIKCTVTVIPTAFGDFDH